MKTLIDLCFEMGMNAIDVLVEIARVNPKIKFLSFHSFIPKEGLKETSGQISPMARLRHDSSDSGSTVVRKLTSAFFLAETEAMGKRGWARGVLSRVRFENKTFHIPMMDFSCEETEDNLAIIREFLEGIGQENGVILSSGRSYHYYGAKLFSEEEWLKFLGLCLLLTGYVEERYIGHRLLDGCGILRISAAGIKPKIPTVVSIL